MTTPWREVVPCGRCGVPVSTETPIKAWIRSHENLDSRQACLCIGDSDLWVHRYGTREGPRVDRDVKYLMLVEIKTHGRDLNAQLRDLYLIINDLLRTNTWKVQRDNGQFLNGHDQNSRIVRSSFAGRPVQVHCFGVHLLRLTGATPDTSDLIKWDRKTISRAELVELLRFDRSPDSLRLMEHRSHKRRDDHPTLPLEIP
jgi:hypothetical protein